MIDQFLLQPHADTVYESAPRRLAFRAQTQADFRTWQEELRQKVVALLGLSGRPPPQSVAAELLTAVDRGRYVEEKYSLDAGEGVQIPVYLLVPKGTPPYRPVLVFHGHNPSVQWILGNYPNTAERNAKLRVDNNYAQALAEAGYLVCALEQRGFGERQTEDGRGTIHENSCRHLAFAYQLVGRTLIGERCWDGMCAIAFLQSQAHALPGILGCTGNSGGGTTALWLSAIDERITVCVPSCYLCSFRESIYNLRHCECNYVPGILEWAEMGDLDRAARAPPHAGHRRRSGRYLSHRCCAGAICNCRASISTARACRALLPGGASRRTCLQPPLQPRMVRPLAGVGDSCPSEPRLEAT